MSPSEYLRCTPKYTISGLNNQNFLGRGLHPTPLGTFGARPPPTQKSWLRLWRKEGHVTRCGAEWIFMTDQNNLWIYRACLQISEYCTVRVSVTVRVTIRVTVTVRVSIKLSATYTFSTSPNLCHRTTLLNTDVPNCHITLEFIATRLLLRYLALCTSYLLCPQPLGGDIKRCFCLTSVCRVHWE